MSLLDLTEILVAHGSSFIRRLCNPQIYWTTYNMELILPPRRSHSEGGREMLDCITFDKMAICYVSIRISKVYLSFSNYHFISIKIVKILFSFSNDMQSNVHFISEICNWFICLPDHNGSLDRSLTDPLGLVYMGGAYDNGLFSKINNPTLGGIYISVEGVPCRENNDLHIS